MKYRVLSANRVSSLAEEVNELMAEGWTPIGGIAIEGIGSYICYYQAMVRN